MAEATVGKGLIAWVVYVILIVAMTLVMGVDYTQIADNTDNILKGMIVPVATASAGMAVLASMWRWWGPALKEANPARHRWPIVVPILMTVAALIGIFEADLASLDSTYLLYLAGGVLLVGFGEEMATRGLLIVGLRGGMGERMVWFLSTLLFAAMHSLNFLFGQSMSESLSQVGATFLVGTGFYVLRRTGRYLVLCMALHALWDFSLFAFNESGAEAGISSVLVLVTPILALIVVWFTKESRNETPAMGTT